MPRKNEVCSGPGFSQGRTCCRGSNIGKHGQVWSLNETHHNLDKQVPARQCCKITCRPSARPSRAASMPAACGPLECPLEMPHHETRLQMIIREGDEACISSYGILQMHVSLGLELSAFTCQNGLAHPFVICTTPQASLCLKRQVTHQGLGPWWPATEGQVSAHLPPAAGLPGV